MRAESMVRNNSGCTCFSTRATPLRIGSRRPCPGFGNRAGCVTRLRTGECKGEDDAPDEVVGEEKEEECEPDICWLRIKNEKIQFNRNSL